MSGNRLSIRGNIYMIFGDMLKQFYNVLNIVRELPLLTSHLFICNFLLVQKVTKKHPGNDNSPFPVGFSIGHQWYCGEEHWPSEVDDWFRSWDFLKLRICNLFHNQRTSAKSRCNRFRMVFFGPFLSARLKPRLNDLGGQAFGRGQTKKDIKD